MMCLYQSSVLADGLLNPSDTVSVCVCVCVCVCVSDSWMIDLFDFSYPLVLSLTCFISLSLSNT